MTSQYERPRQLIRVTRRGFLSGVAASAGAVGAALLPIEAVGPQLAVRRFHTQSDRFSRLFNLPPFAGATPQVQSALLELGAPGGLMDAKDPLHEGPIRLITNPELSPNNRDNPSMTAGFTFLGQFLDHDLTFGAASRLGEPTPRKVLRTPVPPRSISIRSTEAVSP